MTTAYAFTSKYGYLNKAHAQHLKARLIGALAQAAKRSGWRTWCRATLSTEGRGYESPNGFTVLKGANGRRDFTASSPDSLMRTREQLIRQGVLARHGKPDDIRHTASLSLPDEALRVEP